MPTLAAYRRALWAALDDGMAHFVFAGRGDGAQVRELADSTPGASVHRYDGAYAYLASGAGANQQRRIVNGSFDPATGDFDVELSWAAPAPGDEVEITHLFACTGYPQTGAGVSPEDVSYLGLVNMALRRLWVPDRVTLTFAGTASADTSSLPWLDRPERLVAVLEPAPVASFPPVPADWRGPRLVADGTTPVLQLDRPYAGTLTLEVRRPADTLISGVESAVGMTTEGQTALAQVADVVAVGLAEAYRALMNRTPGRPNGAWAEKYAAQEAVVARLYALDRTQQAPRAAPGDAA